MSPSFSECSCGGKAYSKKVDFAFGGGGRRPTRVNSPTYHAIERLMNSIADLQEVGLTLREIAGRLTDLGFRISEGTLQSYLRRAVKSLGVPPLQTAAPADKGDLNPFELDIEVSDEPVVGQSAQTLPAASEDDLNPFELDIEVSDEPVIDHQFEHWFQKG